MGHIHPLPGQHPAARVDGLVTERIGEELLVYDTDQETAHALTAIAAAVWHAADGTRDIGAIADHAAASQSEVRDVLRELAALGLLSSSPAGGVSRRDALKRLSTIGAAATAAPIIVSAVIWPASAAASGGTKAVCSPCIPNGAGSDACGQGLYCAPNDICMPTNCTPAVNGMCASGTVVSRPNTTTCPGQTLCCL